ncbi:MAG: UDP-glucose 4-epimerase GalE [Geminicoccaceae bacterium]|nr:UDP-glucose 4-epimerase GalE [Geminicoccaceae bacterium]
MTNRAHVRRPRSGSVLVTGGAGYIGSHVVLALADAGWPVVILDNLSTGRLGPAHARAAFVEGEVDDQQLVARLLDRHDVVAVIHMAGSIVVPDSVRDPLSYYDNNTVAAHALLDVCARRGLDAFIFSSTAAVYGAAPSPIAETARTEPLNAYGASKLMIERIVRDVAYAHDLPFAVLRYFNVAGADPGGRAGQLIENATHLLKVACEAALGERSGISVFGTDYPTRDGTCIRDFIHVSDLASAHVAAVEHLVQGGSSCTLNCGYGRGFSVREVLEAVQRLSGNRLDIREAPRRPGDAAEVIADVTRIRETLDWQPEFARLDDIVTHALAWEHKRIFGR